MSTTNNDDITIHIRDYAWKCLYEPYIKPRQNATIRFKKQIIPKEIIGMTFDNACNHVRQKYRDVNNNIERDVQMRHINNGRRYDHDDRNNRCNVWTDDNGLIYRVEWF